MNSAFLSLGCGTLPTNNKHIRACFMKTERADCSTRGCIGEAPSTRTAFAYRRRKKVEARGM